MSSFYTCGKIHFKPDENDLAKCGTEDGYAFSVPTVCLESEEELYAPQTVFSWGTESVVLCRESEIVRFSDNMYTELYAEDENGNRIWVDGRIAPYEGCWGGHYLNEYRPARSFTTTVYDLKTLTKKEYEYIMAEENSVPMTEHEIAQYADVNTSHTEE